MATSKLVQRLSSRLRSFTLKLGKTSPSLLPSTVVQSPVRRFSRLTRLPSELGAVGSMLPLHTAIASARLIANLSTENRSLELVSQGLRKLPACSEK